MKVSTVESRTWLYDNYKKITVKYMKQQGFSKETIDDILFAMHVVSYELLANIDKLEKLEKPIIYLKKQD